MSTQKVSLLGFYSHSHHFHDVEGLSNKDLARELSQRSIEPISYTPELFLQPFQP